jgi:RNA polymerase sigma-70 factor (ECF subfamily)
MLHLLTPTDDQLMWRVKSNDDAQAFGLLMGRWQKPIENLCFRMTGDVHRAEDLSQTVFARLFSRRATWKPIAKFSTFLWRIALNICHDELRSIKRRGECSLEVLDIDSDAPTGHFTASDPSPDESAARSEQAEMVRAALFSLAPHYREVVALRHYEHLKFQEIAEVLGLPEGTVKSRMAEALTQLTRLLKHINDDTCTPKTQKATSRDPRSLESPNSFELATL